MFAVRYKNLVDIFDVEAPGPDALQYIVQMLRHAGIDQRQFLALDQIARHVIRKTEHMSVNCIHMVPMHFEGHSIFSFAWTRPAIFLPHRSLCRCNLLIWPKAQDIRRAILSPNLALAYACMAPK